MCSGYPLVSSKLAKILGFKGYLPLPLSPTPRSKWELGQPLLSRERAQLRGRGKTENWDSPLHLHSQHLHAQILALPRVMSLAVFLILFYLLIIFCLNLSTFYNSSQVVKTRKNKLKYNVTCNRCLHFLLPATSLAFDMNRVRCQQRQDAVVVKRLKLI